MYSWLRRRAVRAAHASPELATRLNHASTAPSRALRALPPTLRATAIGEALRAAQGPERDTLAADLVEFAALDAGPGGGASLAQIACSWDLLTPEVRRASLAVGGDRWGALCHDLLEHPNQAMRLRALSIIGQCGLAELADRVVDHLLSADPLAASAAERALLDLARAGQIDNAAPRTAPLESAIARAAAAYPDHRKKGVLLAMSDLLATPGALRRPLGALLREASGPIAMAMRGMIRKEPEPRLAGLALLWLTEPALEPACRERLSRISGADLAEAARRTHLLAHPARAAKLLAAATPPGNAAWASTANPLPADLHADLRKGVLRLATILPAQSGSAVVASMIADPSAAVRLAAVRAAASWGEAEPAVACLVDLSFDADERVARAASTALLARRGLRETPGARRTLTHLERSAHGSVRGAADRFGAAMRLGAGERAGGRLRARKALAEDGAAFMDQLRAKIKSGPVAERIAAIQLAMRLGACREVELELLGAAAVGGEARGDRSDEYTDKRQHGPNGGEFRTVHVAATAVRALGRVGSAASGAAVRACLRHPDARIRANAVEAASGAGPAGATRLPGQAAAASEGVVAARFLSDAHHRVRGAAVREVIRSAIGLDGMVRDVELAASAAAAISGMLAHEDPDMRVSGLWALGCASGRSTELAASLAARVEDLSRTDADERVRARAAALSERLMRGMRAGWAARAWQGDTHEPTLARGREREQGLNVVVRAARESGREGAVCAPGLALPPAHE